MGGILTHSPYKTENCSGQKLDIYANGVRKKAEKNISNLTCNEIEGSKGKGVAKVSFSVHLGSSFSTIPVPTLEKCCFWSLRCFILKLETESFINEKEFVENRLSGNL